MIDQSVSNLLTGSAALLVLVRHAESQRNVAKKGAVYFADEEARATVKGIPEHKVPLTSEGLRQAEAAGRFLREQFGAFDYIYHSGYLRTLQTVEGILKAYSAAEHQQMEIRQNLFIR